MNFVIYTKYIKENSIIPPFTLLFSLATFSLSRHYIPPLKVASDSWVCTPQEIFITFSSSFVSRHSSFHYFFRHTPSYCLWPKA